MRRQSWLPLLAATGAAAAVASALVVWLRVIGLNASASQPHETSLAAQTIVTACLSIASFALFAALFAWPILRRELARIEATRIEGDRLVTASLRHAGEHAALLAENHLVRQSLVSLESAIDEEGQAKDAFARESGMGATLLVENHLRLDEAIDDQLRVVVSETEASAMGLIGQVRTLNDAVAELLGYLGNSGRSAGDMETEIEGSVASIAQISRFVRELPDLIRKNANSIHAATLQEISGISGLAAVIQDISKQTNILAINAAIVAATAGEAGLGFAVVATEVRKLAVRSSTAANMIEEGVAEAQRVMMEGLRHTGMSEEIAEAGAMITSIHKLEANYENIRKYYHSMFVVVTEYNTKLATEIADMLGQIQYQDVVRQRIERVTSAVARRNQVLRDLPGTFSESATGLTGLAAQIHEVLDDYLVGEERHTVGVAADSDSGDVLPKFELF